MHALQTYIGTYSTIANTHRHIQYNDNVMQLRNIYFYRQFIVHSFNEMSVKSVRHTFGMFSCFPLLDQGHHCLTIQNYSYHFMITCMYSIVRAYERAGPRYMALYKF